MTTAAPSRNVVRESSSRFQPDDKPEKRQAMTVVPGDEKPAHEECELRSLSTQLLENSIVIRTALLGIPKNKQRRASRHRARGRCNYGKRTIGHCADGRSDAADGPIQSYRRHPKKGHRTPIIAMTTSVTMEDREECLAVGMDGFIAKPVRPDEFHRTIDQFTRSHSAPQSAKSSDEDLSLSERLTSGDVIDLELARRQLPGVRREPELWPSFCSINVRS